MVNGVTVKGVTTGCARPFGGCWTPASARRVAVGPDGVGRERPNADGRRECLAPLHTEANEGLLGGKCFLPDPDREAWAVCQPLHGEVSQRRVLAQRDAVGVLEVA